MRGALSDHNVFVQFFIILLLALVGATLLTAVAVVVAIPLYGLNYESVMEILENPQALADSGILTYIQGFNTIGTFAVPALLGAYLVFDNPAKSIGTDRFTRNGFITIWLMVGLALLGASISDVLFRWMESLPLPEDWHAYFRSQQGMMEEQYRSLLKMESNFEFIEVLFVMALLPALCEELLFRGTLFGIFQRWGNLAAVFITSVLFAGLHLQFYAFLPILVLGITLGLVRLWSRSLWVPTILHFVNNASIVVAVYFFDVSYDNLEVETVSLEPWQVALSVIGFFFIMVLSHRHLVRSRVGE